MVKAGTGKQSRGRLNGQIWVQASKHGGGADGWVEGNAGERGHAWEE